MQLRALKRAPFTLKEWTEWRDEVKSLESDIRERSIHAGIAFGQMAEDRGKRVERALRTYREYIAQLASNRIADSNQYTLEFFDAP